MAPFQTQASVDEKAKGADIGGTRAEGVISAAGSQGTWQMGGNPPYWQPIGKGGKKRQKMVKIGNIGITKFEVISFT